MVPGSAGIRLGFSNERKYSLSHSIEEGCKTIQWMGFAIILDTPGSGGRSKSCVFVVTFCRCIPNHLEFSAKYLACLENTK
jgi:hypothetical protein